MFSLHSLGDRSILELRRRERENFKGFHGSLAALIIATKVPF